MSAPTSMPMRALVRYAVAAAVLVPAARPAAAQDTAVPPVAGAFRVTPRVGAIVFDDAASIENAAHFGLSTDYAITRAFSVGLFLGAAQPRTRAEDYLTFQQVGDTVRVLAVQQALDVFDFGATVGLRPGTYGRFTPYLTGGAGIYSIHLDPQVANGIERITKPMFVVGGGASFRLGQTSAITFDVRDMIWTDYERDRVFPATAGNFPYSEFYPAARATKSTLNNLTFAIGFSFTPRLGGSGDATTGGDQ